MMMVRRMDGIVAAVAAASIAALSCAGSETETTPPPTASAAQSSASGAGGAGGEGEGGAGGEGGMKPPCAVDCAALPSPPCHIGVCIEATGQCVVIPSPGGEPCDDGLFCTVGEFCKNGVCGSGSDNTCGAFGDACNTVVCDEDKAACMTAALDDGTPCVSDDLCVVNATCSAGVCQGAAKDCFFAPVPDVCHVAVCNPTTGSCEPAPGNDGTACPDDGDKCMLNKKCMAGQCLGTIAKNCSALTEGCFVGVCDQADGACKAQPLAAGSACPEAADECHLGLCDDVGACLPSPTPGVQCASKTDDCNLGTCDAAGACVASPANEAGACEDDDSCTTGETCSAGACTGGVLNNYVVYFSEPFTSDMTGWTLGPEWQIGPASASACSGFGNPDPAADFTATPDNGVAGVAIGGCAEHSLHGLYYLESPPVDTNVPGSVFLDVQRWLNSDYKPYMRNTIEVWDGSVWVLVWQSGGPPAIKDPQWTRVTHDLTDHKNAAMKVRFGFEVQNAQGFTVSGWNIDDVILSNNICK
jgi:hypothetical protein